jgi:hypothetical protein
MPIEAIYDVSIYSPFKVGGDMNSRGGAARLGHENYC